MKWSNQFSKKTARRYQLQIKRSKSFTIILFIIVVLLVTHQLLFTIRQTDCHLPDNSTCSVELTNFLSTQKGKSLFLVNKKKLVSSLQELSPASQIQLELSLPGKLTLNIKSIQPLAVSVFLNYLEPSLSLDSSRSANLKSPLGELDSFVSSLSGQVYNLFPSGELVPGGEASSIKLLFSQKPPQQKLKQIFILIATINHALPITKGYHLNNSLYLASTNLPDIIINSNSSVEELSGSLQAIPSLAKIKEGIKIIDLRFKHPVIR
jgi:hypothetical protein